MILRCNPNFRLLLKKETREKSRRKPDGKYNVSDAIGKEKNL